MISFRPQIGVISEINVARLGTFFGLQRFRPQIGVISEIK